MINFYIISTFPKTIAPYLGESILKRALEKKLVKISFYNPRDFTADKHHKTDDRPYGGGPGMVMYAEPILRAVQKVKRVTRNAKRKAKFLITSPAGKTFTNQTAIKWAKQYTDIIVICGHYEGIDARVKKILKAEEVSVGPYVLTGGELPAAIIVDAITRQLPGALGNELSPEEKRISSSEMYTWPENLKYDGKKYRVPKVLLSGNHKKIEEWKKKISK